jgi:hypothetical protein
MKQPTLPNPLAGRNELGPAHVTAQAAARFAGENLRYLQDIAGLLDIWSKRPTPNLPEHSLQTIDEELDLARASVQDLAKGIEQLVAEWQAATREPV